MKTISVVLFSFTVVAVAPALAEDTVVPGWGAAYGTKELAVSACAQPQAGRVKVIELIAEPGNCVLVRYVKLGVRSCSYSMGPGATEDTRHALEQICKRTSTP